MTAREPGAVIKYSNTSRVVSTLYYTYTYKQYPEVLEMADQDSDGEKQSELQELFRLTVSIVENPHSLGE